MTNVLATKLRPRSLDDVVGQDAVIKTLKYSLSTGRLHHAYCFIGSRGTGKTTVSRIFSKGLNCLSGITTEPCGCCTACLDVERVQQIDYVEIDAATHRGIEEMVLVLEGSAYSPIISRYKIFVIDEAHMLTAQAFSSMLRVLEEPPDHAKFILCATDSTKIPATILSRTVNLCFNLVDPKKLEELVSSVLKSENQQFQDGIPELLAKLAEGSVRDALTLTERALVVGCGKLLTIAAVNKVLSTPEEELLKEVAQAVIRKDVRAVTAVTRELSHRSSSFGYVLSAVLLSLYELLRLKLSYAPIGLSFRSQVVVRGLAMPSSCKPILLVHKVLLNGVRLLRLSDDQLPSFGVILLRTILCSAGS